MSLVAEGVGGGFAPPSSLGVADFFGFVVLHLFVCVFFVFVSAMSSFVFVSFLLLSNVVAPSPCHWWQPCYDLGCLSASN